VKTLVKLLTGVRKGNYPVWKSALFGSRGRTGIGQLNSNHICPSMKSKSRSVRIPSRKPCQKVDPPLRPAGQMPVINSHAAGIDVGATSHWVCVPEDAVPEVESPVREFGAFTKDLDELVEWLLKCGVKNGGDGIDVGLLDSTLSKARSGGTGSAFGQRPARSACAGAQERLQGLPMAATVA